MRLDIRHDSPELCARAKVFLNGEQIKFCLAADEELGMVRRYKSLNGHLVIENNDAIATELIYGKVEIKFEEQ